MSEKQETKKLRKDLQSLQRYIEEFSMFLPLAVCGLNPKRIIVNVNQAAKKLCGQGEISLVGEKIDVIFKEDVNRFLDKVDEKKELRNKEFTLITSEEEEIPVSLSASVREDDQGNMLGYFLAISDLTELKKAEQQMLHAEKMATIGTIAGGVAHEINNPLGAVLIRTQMLLKKEEDQEKKESLKEIEKNIQRCKEITNGLLHYSRPSELGSIDYVNINEIVKEACNLLKPHLNQRDIKLQQDLEQLPRIKGNSNKLQQLLTNLIINARDAIQQTDGKEGWIRIKTALEQNHVTIKVLDNGCGMPEEKLDRIFDPFYTTKDVDKGTGLGLSIIQKIVEAHEGEIKVDSKEDVGTEFVVRLPVGK